MSQIRQNFHQEVEALINKQIKFELYCSYVYQSVAFYFARDDVAFPGFHEFFCKAADEEREHAEKLMKYQNQRGGRVILQSIQKPEKDEWGTPLDALQVALKLERDMNQALLNLHKLADSHGDAHLTDYLEKEFLGEQVEAIKNLGDKITKLKRCGTGIGEYVFDKEDMSS